MTDYRFTYKSTCFRNVVLWILFPLILSGQITPIAEFRTTYPDFGGVSGNWGHFQIYRPFGTKAIVLEDWRDQLLLNPINGEPMNLLLPGWHGLSDSLSLWNQAKPSLTAPGDTIVPSLMVNYHQGYGEFKDFTLWFHTALAPETRIGWVSQKRSHPRFSDTRVFNQQDHRFQVETRFAGHPLRLEIGHNRLRNPLYLFSQDTITQLWLYNNDLQLSHDDYTGYLHWQQSDSTFMRREAFYGLRAAYWTWPEHSENEWTQLGFYGENYKLKSTGLLHWKLGWLSRQLGPDGTNRHLAEIGIKDIQFGLLHANAALKNYGKWSILPEISIRSRWHKLEAAYELKPLIDEYSTDNHLETGHVHQASLGLAGSFYRISAGVWSGSKGESESFTGQQVNSSFNFPWQMSFSLNAARLIDGGTAWTWDKERITWRLNQELLLFNRKMHMNISAWGMHHFQASPGFLDEEDLLVYEDANMQDNQEIHQLNYSLQVQVSTVIFAFTDLNMLQDPLWENYFTPPWESEYSMLYNQLPEIRFQYFTLIWVFDN